jgi:ABC-type multidrug transport system fused ATPase/permease subunit
MVKKVLQNYLYQKRNLIKQSIRPLKIEEEQKVHIKFFWRKNKKMFWKVVILSALAIFLQLLMPLFTNFYIKKYSFLLEINKLTYSLLVLLLILIVYLIVSYLSIKYESTLFIYFLNYLRRKWFSLYLNKNIFSLKSEDKSKVIAKISYHFSLLQMGISNSLFSLIPWLLLSSGLLIFSFFISSSLLLIVIISILVNLLIIFLAYVIAKYYVSQHQTLYSKILVFLGNSLNEFDLIKLNKREKKSLDQLDELVEIDSYFRIRRNLLMKYGNKIIFSLVIFMGALVYLIEIYHPFLKIENSAQYLVYAMFFSLIIKLSYLSLKIGLFSFPLKLGAVLCIPQEKSFLKSESKKELKIWEIKFKSKRYKLKNGKCFRNLDYNFKSGERILFFGPEGCAKSSLGIVFSGNANFTDGRSWVLKINQERFLYRQWQKIFKVDTYLIHPNFQTEDSILSILMGEDFSLASNEDIENVFSLLSKYPVLDFVNQHNKSIVQNVNKLKFSFTDKALIQMAHALLNPPSVLVIDNVYLDIDSDRIKKMISILDENLKDTIIILSSTKDNDILKYAKKYNLGD